MGRYMRRFPVKLISATALKQFLRFRGMSYRELAEKAGCSKALIGHLASGRRTRTGVDIALAISKILDVPIDALFLPELPTASESSTQRPRKKTA